MLKRRWLFFYRLSWRMKLLFIVTFFLTGLVRFSILVIPFRYLSVILGEKSGNTSEEVEHDKLVKASKVGRVVETVSRHTPWESKCLVKAITAQLFLKILRIPNTLYLGVSHDPENNNMLAHAWLRCGQLILTGANERPGFKVVAQFAWARPTN